MEFRILGPLEVRNGDETVRIGAAKQRALLGVLLLHANETVSTARLVDELWGERSPATAGNLVQGYVHALRKQLGDGVVETQAPGYRVRVDPGSLDALEFERLTDEARTASVADAVELRRRALGLWRGPALADVVLEGPERHNVGRLGELRLTTQLERIDGELQLGRNAQVVGELEALVAEHPYRERAAALLMLALYRSGRQAEALEAYRTVRRRLSDELGLEPGPELRDLESAILRQDEALAAPIAVREPPVEEAAPTRRHRRRLALGGALALVAAAIAIGLLVLLDDPEPLIAAPNSVAVIDAETNRVVRTIPVGNTPGPVSAGEGFVWMGNVDEKQKELIRIDPATYEYESTRLDVTPDAVTVGAGAVWVLNGRLATLYRVDPASLLASSGKPAIGPSSSRPGAGVDVGEGSVWAAFGDESLARVDPTPIDGDAFGGGTFPVTATGPTGLVVAYGVVWVASAAGVVEQFSPETYDEGPLPGPLKVCSSAPSGIAWGARAVWVVCQDQDVLARIAPHLNFAFAKQIAVGNGPAAVAVGAGAVWVANRYDGTVSRIDPETSDVEKVIDVGNAPTGIAVWRGRVWVSVQAAVSP